ncbi:MAG: DUF6883 domain-containing protein [Phormidesmis sp.]
MKLKDLVNTIFIDPRKLTDYALSPSNPKGKHKAFLFKKRLGYTQNNYQLLLAQIESQALEAEAIPKHKDRHGQRYQIDLRIQGIQPEQKETVRTGWIVPPSARQATLTTAYIKKNHG